MSEYEPRPGILRFQRKDDLREGMGALDGKMFWFRFAGRMDGDSPYRGQRIWSFDRRHDMQLGELASYWVPDCDINFRLMVDGREWTPEPDRMAHAEQQEN